MRKGCFVSIISIEIKLPTQVFFNPTPFFILKAFSRFIQRMIIIGLVVHKLLPKMNG
jgi:hypothetical protein